MKRPEDDFRNAKRGAVVPVPKGKTRITIYLDDTVLRRFKAESQRTGKGYQTLINEALKSCVEPGKRPVTQELAAGPWGRSPRLRPC